MFGKQLYFPTTNLLMYSNDEYSSEFKDQIRQSVNKDFSIQLPTAEDEKKDEKDARKRIKDVVRVIIGKVKDGYLVLQHNIEYGFVRNLWGASLVGILGSTLLMSVSVSASPLYLIGKIFLIVFGIYLVFGFLVIKYMGHAYARKLIEEYYKTSHEK